MPRLHAQFKPRHLTVNPEQLMCGHLPSLADFPTEAVNLDRGEGLARVKATSDTITAKYS